MIRTLAVLTALAAVLGLAPAAFAEGDAEAGKITFDTLCFTCHGLTGKGDGPAGAALDPPPRDLSVGDFKFDADKNGTPGEDADLALVIANGAGAYGGNPSMAPWGHLSEKEIQDVIAYIHTLEQ